MAVRHVSASDSSSEEESVSSAKMSDKAAEPAEDPVTEKKVSPFEDKGEKKERSKSAGRKSRSRSRHRRRRERKDEKEKKGRKEKKDKDKKVKKHEDQKERDRRGKKDKEEAPCPSASKPSRPSSGKGPDKQNREEHEEVLDTTQPPAHPKDPPKTKVEAQPHEKTKGGQKGKTGKRQCSVCHQWVGKADAAMDQHRWLNSYCLSWQMVVYGQGQFYQIDSDVALAVCGAAQIDSDFFILGKELQKKSHVSAGFSNWTQCAEEICILPLPAVVSAVRARYNRCTVTANNKDFSLLLG